MNARQRRKRSEPKPSVPATAGLRDHAATAMAVAACASWCWAFLLLGPRDYMIDAYQVISSAPQVWGFIALDNGRLLLGVALAGVLFAGCLRAGQDERRISRSPALWLAAATVIPLLDILRAAGVAVPLTFLEPLFLVVISGGAVGCMARTLGKDDAQDPAHVNLWLAAVWAATAAAAVWFFWQSDFAYREFMLGYHDFGHFARRVVNTWEGRGFLMESPGIPAFWDHFNPGLALLAPLWGLWPDARLFFVIQAVSLVLPAPLVFGIARSWGADARSAAAWAGAYLLFPATSQLNLAFSYGWHPVSLAIPLLFLAVWALLRRRFALAAVVVVLACSFKESVVVAVGCFGAAMLLQGWLVRRSDEDSQDAVLERQLSPWAWAGCWAASLIAFLLIYKLSAFGQFQTSRFSNLGASPSQILLSPLLRPAAFWGQVASHASFHFLAILTIPLGLVSLVRGWRVLIAASLPVVVLLAWQHPPAKCFGFQYVSELLTVLTVAAIAGAARGSFRQPADEPWDASTSARRQQTASLIAFASAVVASAFFGAYPWSAHTISIVTAKTYPVEERTTWENPRGIGSEANRALNQALAIVDQPGAAVLASGRMASHLLGVRRLEAVDQAIARVGTLAIEAGPDQPAISAFDWIVVDRNEGFQQSQDQIEDILEQALAAGYQVQFNQHDILVLQRPRNTDWEMK